MKVKIENIRKMGKNIYTVMRKVRKNLCPIIV